VVQRQCCTDQKQERRTRVRLSMVVGADGVEPPTYAL
jgi:hypothetical protein